MIDDMNEDVLKEMVKAKVKVFLDSEDGQKCLEDSILKEVKERTEKKWGFWHIIRERLEEAFQERVNEAFGFNVYFMPDALLKAGFIEIMRSKGYKVTIEKEKK
jgi:hypothetical protein